MPRYRICYSRPTCPTGAHVDLTADSTRSVKRIIRDLAKSGCRDFCYCSDYMIKRGLRECRLFGGLNK